MQYKTQALGPRTPPYEVEFHRPTSFRDDFGPIAHELGLRYVLFCKLHKVILGADSWDAAYEYAAHPPGWCKGCVELYASYWAARHAASAASDYASGALFFERGNLHLRAEAARERGFPRRTRKKPKARKKRKAPEKAKAAP